MAPAVSVIGPVVLGVISTGGAREGRDVRDGHVEHDHERLMPGRNAPASPLSHQGQDAGRGAFSF